MVLIRVVTELRSVSGEPADAPLERCRGELLSDVMSERGTFGKRTLRLSGGDCEHSRGVERRRGDSSQGRKRN